MGLPTEAVISLACIHGANAEDVLSVAVCSGGESASSLATEVSTVRVVAADGVGWRGSRKFPLSRPMGSPLGA